MSALRLVAHPDTPCPWVDGVTATVGRAAAGTVICRYVVRGSTARLRIPPVAASPARVDGLWRHTCFELFARSAHSPSYAELNVSPSGHWAAYRFDGYRHGMHDLPLAPPAVSHDTQDDCYTLTAAFAGLAMEPLLLAVAVVLEDVEGTIGYWALQHPQGKPDFHHQEGFIARI